MRIARRALLLPAAAALALSACGTASPASTEPSAALQRAVEQLATWEGYEVEARFDTTADSLRALADGEELDPQVAEALADTRMTVQAHGGENASSTEDDASEMQVRFGDLDVVQVITTGTEVYVRSDLQAVLDRFASEADRTQITDDLAQAETMGLGFIDDLLAGDWLRFEGVEELTALAEGMGAGSAAAPDATGVEDAREQLTDAFASFVEQDAQVTYVGAEDAGEHLRVEASGSDVIDLFDESLPALAAMNGQTSGMQQELLRQQLSEMQSGDTAEAAAVTLPVDVWLDDGELARISVDLLDMVAANPKLEDDEIPSGVESFGMTMDLAPFDGEVETPGDAVAVNLFELLGRVIGDGMGPGNFEDPSGGLVEPAA